MSERNFDKTNALEHSVATRGKRVVVAKLSDNTEVMLTAVPIPGSVPPQYALATEQNAVINGNVYVSNITTCSDDGGVTQYFILSDNQGRPAINIDQLNGAVIDTGTGIITVGTQRVTLATDDPAVTTLQAIQAILIAMGIDLAAVVASLDIIDDWDESDRCKVNPIVGQAGVAAGSGASDALTQRVIAATNSPEVTAVEIMDDWDESDRAKVNIIAGQAGVAANAGAADALTQRVIAASDSPEVVALGTLFDGTITKIADLTDQTAATRYFPIAPGYINMNGDGQFMLWDYCDGGVTVTVEVSPEATFAHPIDITRAGVEIAGGYEYDIVSLVDSGALGGRRLDFDDLGNCFVRVKAVTSDATNTLLLYVQVRP